MNPMASSYTDVRYSNFNDVGGDQVIVFSEPIQQMRTVADNDNIAYR